MLTRYCRACGQPFRTTRAYFHSCWNCWSEGNSTAGADATSETRREIERLRSEVERLRVMAEQPRVLDAKTLREIVYLTHPDKHSGSSLATTVTQKLLKMRASAS